MLKPRHNFFITGFLNFYIDWILKRNFHQVEFNQPDFDANISILWIANHFSWWDGFLLQHINRSFFKKKFHAMVLEETMEKVGIFKYLGGFSVAKNSRQIFESLDFAADLLRDPNNMVVIFPQGKLYSNFTDEIEFHKGARYIAQKAGSGFQYVLSAAFVENFDQKKPSANIFLKVLNVNNCNPTDLNKQYQQHYTLSKQQQTAIVV